MVAAQVVALPEEVVSYGHCFTTVRGLNGGELVGIRSGGTTIFCRVAWDIASRLSAGGQVALDRWQRASLGNAEPDAVDLSVHEGVVEVATSLELTPLRGTGEPDHIIGVGDFLVAGHYVVYPGLRFSYRPLAGGDPADYVVSTV